MWNSVAQAFGMFALYAFNSELCYLVNRKKKKKKFDSN